MVPETTRKRVLIFVVAYHAESTIASVIRRVPVSLLTDYDIDVLIIDDSSRDLTFARSHEVASQAATPLKVRVLFNPVNQGYGGNQKLGYRYAIECGYDYVALLHGDGQYAPECLPDLLAPFRDERVAAVFGSRMLPPSGALRGGMPLYKFVGNRILTWIQNRLLRSHLSEFHSGYRVYSVSALDSIPFERNSNDFHFDTQIIIQLLIAKREIRELPIPTYYGDEISRVNGMRYAANVVLSTAKARLQELGIFYDRRYDCAPPALAHPTPKLAYPSPHSFTLAMVPRSARVIDLGCSGGVIGASLKEQKNCFVTGVDASPLAEAKFDAFYLRDIDNGLAGIPVSKHDVILILDVIEHLSSPERFLDQLYESVAPNPNVEILVSTANIGFIIPRLMLLLGQFNYGKRGILDLTHRRLFTFATLRRLFEQAGFDVLEMKPVPGPFPLAFGDNWYSRLLVSVNSVLMHVSRGLFAYQIFVRAKPRPAVSYLLDAAYSESGRRVEAMAAAALAE